MRESGMGRFCYECGSPELKGTPLIEGLCQRCFAREHKLLSAPQELELKVCDSCGACMVGGKWVEPIAGQESGLREAAVRRALSELRVAEFTPAGLRYIPQAQAAGLELGVEPKLGGEEVVVKISARGRIHELQPQPREESISVKVRLGWGKCDVCSLRSVGHYDAILQVRGERLAPERLGELRGVLEACAAEERKRDRRAFVSRIEERREGLDLYVTPASLARKMAALLKAEFGARMSESAKLVGVDRRGRKRFRASVLARLPKG